MNSGSRLFLLLFLLLIVMTPVTRPVRAQTDDRVAELMSQMSVEDKVGQLFLVPFVGAEANPGSEIWQLITEYKVGGVILLTANSNFNNDESAPRQIAELSNQLKTTAFNTNGLPLFVAIDHEGDGFPYTRITRGVAPVPSQMATGATWRTENAEAVGQLVGEELSSMGINLLLGPNLDVLNDPRPAGRGDIGIRVFGGDPYWVGQMGRAYIRGVHQGSQAQVATVAKHFPGHGGSDRLPDNEVATVDKSLQELRRIELPPFFEATRAEPDDPLGVTDALMSSHIRYRGFQGDIRQFTAPISFDAEGMTTLTGLPEISPWRENGGLIVSDALGVPAVRRHFDPSLEAFPHRRIAKDAFLAGNDVLSLVQFDLKSIWSDQFANIKDTIFFFRTEYLNNPAFAAQVDEAVARILQLKLKLHPELTVSALNVAPDRALEVAGQPRPVIDNIARQAMTLLYPSPEELKLRVPEPPRPDEQILIINDTRFARECFEETCEPKELFIPRNTLQDTILRLYGPGATGQIQPDRISTITYSELKLALSGSILPQGETSADTAGSEENQAIQLSAAEVRDRIQAADWLIFAALDLNISRYPDSDALKLFLSQEGGTLRNKKTVVFAFNAPYYLDTTEVTKLTGYFGAYGKTQPHIEAAVRALFGESDLAGASPVTIEGIGYELPNVLVPDPDREIPVVLLDASPEDGMPPVAITVAAGPVLDYNGNLVPDDTAVQFEVSLAGRQIDTEMAATEAGIARAILIINQSGEVTISASAGGAVSQDNLSVMVQSPPTVTPLPVTPTATTVAETSLPTATPTRVPPTPTSPPPQPTATATQASAIPLPESAPPAAAPVIYQPDGLDLLSTLAATMVAGLLGFWLGNQFRQPLNRRVRLGLWVLVGGLLAYLLYALGFIRPEQWLFDSPGLLVTRMSIPLLAFLFGLGAYILSSRASPQKPASQK
jgi:beta-N-acetylhexosaminidase